MKNNLYKNFSWNLFGSLIYAFTQYLIIVVVGRFGNSELLGLYSLGLALTAPIMMFTNLKLRTVQSTGYADEFKFKDFAHIRIFSNIIFFILAILMIVVLEYNIDISLVIIMISISKIIESFSDLFYGKLQSKERLDIVAKSYMLRGLIGTFLFTLIFLIFESIAYALSGLILTWITILIAFDIPKTKPYISRDEKTFKIDKKALRAIIIVSVPLGLLSLLSSLNVNLPRIVIEKTLTLTDLGYFTSVFYLTIILGKFVTSLGAAILPRLSKQYEISNYKGHLSLSIKFSLFIICIGLGIIAVSCLLGNQLLVLLYGNEFSHLGSFLVLVMIYGLFNYLLYSVKISLESTRTFKPQLYVEFINILITLVLSLIWIPELGIQGAIYALIISSIISLIILIFIYIKVFIRLKRGVNN